jgi:hypothetical protein
MKEWFIDIEGYEGLYTISHQGTVLNKSGKPIKAFKKGNSICIHLYKNNKKLSTTVSKLVKNNFKIKSTCKKCTKCNTVLPNKEFNKRTSGTFYSWCKKCNNKDKQERIKDNPDWLMNSRYKYAYGISLKEYKTMCSRQKYKCKICGMPSTDNTHGKLCVDHCHNTGIIRGLLCGKCNKGLGLFNDKVESLYRSGKQSDDENISERQVSFWIDNTRALLVKREADKENFTSPDLIQTLPCVGVELVDASECNCFPVGCKILRTTKPLPKLLESSSKTLLTRVGPIQIGSAPFALIPYARAQWIEDSRYHVVPKAFIHNNYLYIIPHNDLLKTMKVITLSGIFEYPEDLAGYSVCEDGSGGACYTNDDTYPISNWMVEPLKDMIFKNNLRVEYQTPSDNLGNANHDIEPNSTK